MLSTIETINQVVNDFIWGVPAMVCIIGVGFYLSCRTGFLQIRKFSYAIQTTIGRMFRKRNASDGALTPFQAVCTALAATVGTGNIAGVAGAIAIGGPGAVFWMWLSAALGASTAFVEAALAQLYKEKDPLYGGYHGGPAYYIHSYAERVRKKKLKHSVVAVLFALSGLICWGGISQVISNSVSSAFQNAFHIPPIVTTVILVLLAAKLFGKVCPATLHAAVALELLHNASLVHDDVVDESTERRGQLSVNAIFNNKVAVLAGDYLLATALVQVGMTRNHDIIDIVSCLGQDLADGELLQLSNVSNLHFSEEVYFDVIRKKTAVLFAACTKAGALSVGASDEKAESARLFGEYIGLCFQIKDDIFDYSESKEIGKPTGNDMVEGKLTLPALHVLNTVKDKTAEEIAVKIKNGEATPGEIAHLIEFTKQNGGIEYASQVMYDYKEKALSLLASLPDTEVKAALTGYLDYVVEREK